jgi:predicted SAM-dependent methyltransferase
MKLNLCCGAQVADGWVNVDYALGARLAGTPVVGFVAKRLGLTKLDWDERIFIHDLRTRFPWPDGAVEAIYSSHTLEHLTKQEGRYFLTESHRVLRQGGILRIVVPDLRAIVSDYVEGRLAADDFVDELEVAGKSTAGGLKERVAPLFQFAHKCMYDEERLRELLEETGFVAASRPAFDSDIDGIERVELEERTLRAVIVEGRKRSQATA